MNMELNSVKMRTELESNQNLIDEVTKKNPLDKKSEQKDKWS